MGALSIFLFLALLTEIIGTVGGFGSSLFFVPIAGLFFDFHSVLGITAIFHLSSNISKIAFFRKGMNWRLILPIGIPAVLLVIVGAWMSQFADKWLLELLLSVFLLATSISLFFRRFTVRPTLNNSIIGGGLSGLMAGMLGTGGAIRGLTLSAFNLEKEQFIAMSAVIDLGVDLSRSVVYYSNGYVHSHDLYLIPFLLLVSILGTFLGKKILTRFSQEHFRVAVLVLIFITGLTGLIRSLLELTSGQN